MKLLKYLISISLVFVMLFAFSACGSDANESGSISNNENSESIDSSPVTQDEIAALYTDADSFKGRTYEFTGVVLDVEKDGENLYLQVYQDIKNYENNTIVQYPNTDLKVKADDFVSVAGTVDGVFSGENAFGGEVTAPQVTASNVEKIEAVEAFPALKKVKVKKTIEKGPYKVTVSKVDFTEDELRIYLKVENGSSQSFDNYPDQGVVIQDGSQIEASWSEYYPQPSTDLKAGASSKSVIVFENIEQEDFTYSFNGYDSDYNELEFSFDIEVD